MNKNGKSGRWGIIKWILTAAVIILFFPVGFSLLVRCSVWLSRIFGTSILITDTYSIDFKSYVTLTVSMISCAVSATIAYNSFKLTRAVNENKENEVVSKTRYYLVCLLSEIEKNIEISKNVINKSETRPTVIKRIDNWWFGKMENYASQIPVELIQQINTLYNFFDDVKCSNIDKNIDTTDLQSRFIDVPQRIKQLPAMGGNDK